MNATPPGPTTRPCSQPDGPSEPAFPWMTWPPLLPRRPTFLLLAYYLLHWLWSGIFAPWTRLDQHTAIARDLYALDPAGDLFTHSYYLEAPLHFLLANLLGATSRLPYLIYCLGLVLLGYLLFAWLSRRRWGPLGMLAMGLALIAHPVTYILHTWIGLTDGITFTLTVVVLMTRSAPLVGLAGLLGMLNHPMFALVLAAVALLRWLRGEVRLWFIASGLAGVVGGRVLAVWLLHRSGAEIVDRLAFARDLLTPEHLLATLDALPQLVYSFYFALLIPVALALPGLWRADRRYTAVYLLFQALSALLVFVTYDKTRVFAMLTWATTLHFLVTAAAVHAERITAFLRGARSRRALFAIPLFALALPRYMITDEGGFWAPGFAFLWRNVGRLVGAWLSLD